VTCPNCFEKMDAITDMTTGARFYLCRHCGFQQETRI